MSAWFLDSELSTCYRSHKFPCRSLLLSTTVLNDTLVIYMQCTINTNVCVCNCHPVAGDLMLIAVNLTGKSKD